MKASIGIARAARRRSQRGTLGRRTGSKAQCLRGPDSGPSAGPLAPSLIQRLDEGDFFLRQPRRLGRHRRQVAFTLESLHEQTLGCVAGNDCRSAVASFEDCPQAVESQARLRVFAAVALEAVLGENRLNLGGEFDLRRIFGSPCGWSFSAGRTCQQRQAADRTNRRKQEGVGRETQAGGASLIVTGGRQSTHQWSLMLTRASTTVQRNPLTSLTKTRSVAKSDPGMRKSES